MSKKSEALQPAVNAVFIRKPNLVTVKLPLVGVTPLIVHQWSEKAKKEMLDKQMGAAKKTKAFKNPEQDYEDSLYRTSTGEYGFPAVAFKAAAVRAAKMADIPMVDARQMFRVIADDGDLVIIKGEPSMREDMVRLNGATADIRYRGEFRSWEVDLTVQFNADLISHEQLVNLFEGAGFSVGVGEWRIEKNGNFGCFEIKKEK